MTAAKYAKLCSDVAHAVNVTMRPKSGAVTVDQVKSVATGAEATVNHPVIAEIRNELKRRGVKIPGERP